jgi:hypothetical protein
MLIVDGIGTASNELDRGSDQLSASGAKSPDHTIKTADYGGSDMR